MTPVESKIYTEVLRNIKQNIDKIKLDPNPLAEMIRLRQVTGYAGILSSEMENVSSKFDRAEEIIRDAIENGEKTIVFSNWTTMTDAFSERIRNLEPLIITGETDPAERQRIVNISRPDLHNRSRRDRTYSYGSGERDLSG